MGRFFSTFGFVLLKCLLAYSMSSNSSHWNKSAYSRKGETCLTLTMYSFYRSTCDATPIHIWPLKIQGLSVSLWQNITKNMFFFFYPWLTCCHYLFVRIQKNFNSLIDHTLKVKTATKTKSGRRLCHRVCVLNYNLI